MLSSGAPVHQGSLPGLAPRPRGKRIARTALGTPATQPLCVELSEKGTGASSMSDEHLLPSAGQRNVEEISFLFDEQRSRP